MNLSGNMLNALFLTVITSPAMPQQHAPKEAGPVNIVLFIADDLGTTDIGPYGNKVVRTPNLDKLAKESVLFSSAFASSPTCAPSRASIYTGLMPFRNGAHANHTGVRNGVRTLPVYLQPLSPHADGPYQAVQIYSEFGAGNSLYDTYRSGKGS
jgi:hypothetical protein